MGKIIDTVERVLFGATAQERVDMQMTLVIDALDRAFDGAMRDVWGDDEHQDSEKASSGDGA